MRRSFNSACVIKPSSNNPCTTNSHVARSHCPVSHTSRVRSRTHLSCPGPSSLLVRKQTDDRMPPVRPSGDRAGALSLVMAGVKLLVCQSKPMRDFHLRFFAFTGFGEEVQSRPPTFGRSSPSAPGIPRCTAVGMARKLFYEFIYLIFIFAAHIFCQQVLPE